MRGLWRAIRHPVRAFGLTLVALIARTLLRKVDKSDRLRTAIEHLADEAAEADGDVCGTLYESSAGWRLPCTRRAGHPGPCGQAYDHRSDSP